MGKESMNRKSLIRLASVLPRGSKERKVLLRMAGSQWTRKVALNKYDPGELLTALVTLLDRYRLKDVVMKLKKLTPEIQEAWNMREEVF